VLSIVLGDGQTRPGPFAEFVIIALKRPGLIESTSGETPKDQHGSGMPTGNSAGSPGGQGMRGTERDERWRARAVERGIVSRVEVCAMGSRG